MVFLNCRSKRSSRVPWAEGRPWLGWSTRTSGSAGQAGRSGSRRQGRVTWTERRQGLQGRQGRTWASTSTRAQRRQGTVWHPRSVDKQYRYENCVTKCCINWWLIIDCVFVEFYLKSHLRISYAECWCRSAWSARANGKGWIAGYSGTEGRQGLVRTNRTSWTSRSIRN